jgi:asparagine synthase (glutamine-hydrolysing)
VTGPYELTPLEIACGFVMPARRPMAPLPNLARETTPRAAFELAITEALQRPPCLVSFSGGRDSSAVLAVAATVARREGLTLPVPITHRFPAAADTDESAWQEQVVTHLGLDDWVRLEVAGELDCVGPVASDVLRRHGLLWPVNAYFHVPILDAAAGGTVMSGIGGDEAFSSSSWARQIAVLTGRIRPEPRDVLRVGLALSPAPVKAAYIRRRLPAFCAWLQPEARRSAQAWVAADLAREPVRWRTRYRHLAGSAVIQAGLASLDALAQDAGAAVAHPFSDARFLAAIAAMPPDQRPRSRGDALASLVGDVLPEALVRRSTKASFGEVFWGDEARSVMAGWHGEDVDPSIVNIERLRAEWSGPAPDPHTVALLQSVWLRQTQKAARV